jgi:hypothetical protein
MRARSSQSSLTLAALALAGCSGGAATVVRSPPRTLSTVANARVDDGRADGSQRLVVRHIPRVASIAEDTTVIDASSRDTLVVLSSARAMLRGQDVTFAHERPAAPIVGAVRNARGWTFATVDGELWAADDFLGDLRFVSQIAGEIQVNPSAGMLVAIDESLSVTLCDGVTTSRWPAEATQSAAFADERFGAAVLADGRVKVTFDGGRTERELDLGAGAARAVELVGDSLVLQTSDGLRAVRPDGTLVATQRVAAPRSLSYEQQWNLARAFALRWPRGLTHELANTLSPHNWLALGRSLLRFDARTGGLIASYRDVLPSSRCAARPWGDRALVSCAGGEFEAVFRSEDGMHASPFADRSSASFLLSDDATHAVSSSACEFSFGLDRSTDARLCTLGASGRFRNLWRESMTGDVAAVRGARAIVVDRSTRLASVITVDLEQGQASPRGLAPHAASSLALGAAGIAADATPWATYYGADAADPTSLSLALWAGPGPARLLPLPDGARSVAVIDARHVVAVGSTAETLALSDDGGARWEPATLPMRGDPGRIVTVEPEQAWGRATCGADGCLHGSLWIGRDSAPARDVLVAPPVTAPAPTVSTTRAIPRWFSRGAEVDCAERGPGVALATERQAMQWGRYDLAARALPNRSVELRLSWTLDAPGSAAIHRAHATVEASRSAAFVQSALDQRWRVPVATERYALVERCGNGVERRVCDRFVASASGLRPLDELSAYGAIELDLARADGSRALLLERSAESYAALALLDRDGRVAAIHAIVHTNYAWDVSTIAARGALLGVLAHTSRRSPPERSFVALFDGARPIAPRVEPLPSFSDGSLVPCEARSRRGALVVVSGTTDALRHRVNAQEFTTTGDTSMVVELSPNEPMCVRASGTQLGLFSATLPDTSDPRRNVPSLSVRAADGSALYGSMVIDGRLRPLRCVLR